MPTLAPERESCPAPVPGNGPDAALRNSGNRRNHPDDAARRLMIRHVAAMGLDERIALFEALSRDAAWARSAVRVR